MLYEEISSNKRKTWVLLTVFSVFAILLFIVLGAMFEVDPIASLIFGTIFAVFYCLISFYMSDKVALMTQGAKEVNKSQAFEIVAMVENLSIAAGIKTPKVYIIDDPSPNAFATGRDPEHASVAVTTGLLERLNKIELEGVLAHEISHIRNYDIRVMTLVVVLVGLIALISNILIRIPFYTKNSRSKNNQAFFIAMIAGLVLGILAPFIAQIIKLAVSRTREYLADASAIMLTRHADGLISALQKISDGPKLKRANHATAHLYISDPFKGDKKKKVGFFTSLFSTHPPINERISKLRNI